jgi:hypothetical protein
MKHLFVIALLALAAVAAGGFAYAAIPSSNGTITGCLDAKGSLKVIDAEAGVTCGGGKRTLTWNQQGPPGPAGAQGPQGSQGVAGPSDAYVASTSAKAVAAGSGYQTIATLNLPGGAYVIAAKASVLVPGVSGVTCELGAYDGSDLQNLSLNMSNNYGNVALMRAVTSSGPFTATLKCASGGAGATIQNGLISAIKVGSLTKQ